MNFDLTDEHKMIRDMSRDFADEVIAPRAEDMERTGEYPYDILAQMAELGMMGIPFPEEYGGSGGDWRACVHGRDIPGRYDLRRPAGCNHECRRPGD